MDSKVVKESSRQLQEELKSFTGLGDIYFKDLLKRDNKYPDHKKEWLLWSPKTEEEIKWFYRSSKTYLFGNAIHIMPDYLYSKIKPGSNVFDFGGGAGTVSFTLSKYKTCSVTYFDVNYIQQQFVRYLSNKQSLNIEIIDEDDHCALPLKNNYFDYVIGLDVFEHIPKYPHYIAQIAKSLKKGGVFYVYAPFGNSEPSHLIDNYGFQDICAKNSLKNIGQEIHVTAYEKV